MGFALVADVTDSVRLGMMKRRTDRPTIPFLEKSMIRSTIRPAAAATLALLGAVACSDTTSPAGNRTVTVAFATRSAAALNLAPSLDIAAGPIVITRAQLVFSELEMEPVGASCATGTSAEPDDDHCPELKVGPTLVDLPLDASAKSILSVGVPAGSYEEIEFEIDAVSTHSDDDPQAVAAFLAAHPDLEGVSIRVEGTYNGTPFVFTTGVEVEMELEFQPAILIDGTVNALVINVDVASWFQTETGAWIDPTTANAGGENKSKVDENIEKSFDAHEDSIEQD